MEGDTHKEGETKRGGYGDGGCFQKHDGRRARSSQNKPFKLVTMDVGNNGVGVCNTTSDGVFVRSRALMSVGPGCMCVYPKSSTWRLEVSDRRTEVMEHTLKTR